MAQKSEELVPVSSHQPSITAAKRPESATSVETIYKLPPAKKEQWFYRQLRHVLFTVYRRLFATVFLLNIAGFIVLETRHTSANSYLVDVATAASANLCVAILARQDYIINAMCEICVAIPRSMPLRFRRIMAKIYEFGGVHSGASFCSVLWFLRLTVLLTTSFADNTLRLIPALVLAWVLLMLFIGIIIFAYPSLRMRTHNTFERTHRFAGWTANILFWTLIVLAAKALSARATEPRTTGQVLARLPSFYLLTLNTLHTIVPWLRLRKLPATPEYLSDHALRLHLKADIKPFVTIRISDSPLTEWHSFACFPDARPLNGSTNSVVISNAGDWTARTITSPQPFYWTRGLPTRGVLYLALMFRRVVVVTTGSGIGPCLNLLAKAAETRPQVRVLWSTPRPLETFGSEIVEAVMQCDEKAVIVDTTRQGRPDILALTWQLAMDMGAEAVFCISNPRVTKKVVYGMESRGFPAYGPIFDS